jgi:hypothetical protein
MLSVLSAAAPLAAPRFVAGAPYGHPSFVHTATLLPNGKVLLVGTGAINDKADVYDPATNTWAPTPNPNSAHLGHGAVLLGDLRVMVLDNGNTGEIYDVRSNTWTLAPGPASHRVDQMGCFLLPDGRLIQLGGSTAMGVTLANVSVFTPSTNAWSALMSMNAPRHGQATAMLADNRHILVAGGDDDVSSLVKAELYDLSTNTWTNLPDLNIAHSHAHALTLSTGDVLVFGGAGGGDLSTQLFHPATNTWSPGGNLMRESWYSSSVLLPNGKILSAASAKMSPISQLYDPASNTWSDGPSISSARVAATGTLLPTGRVLVAGGSPDGVLLYDSVDLYDLGPGSWSAGAPLTVGRASATTTPLPDGAALIAGGENAGGVLGTTLRVSAQGSVSTAAAMRGARKNHAAALLPDGRVFVAGGVDTAGTTLASAELYDPGTDSWVAGAPMFNARFGHTATALPNGRVLVVGGATTNCELYDARTDQWLVAAPLAPARSGHSAVLLPDGRVLVTGGGPLPAAVYDPNGNSWSAGASLSVSRTQHTATILLSGKVLLAGGGAASTELYDPTGNTSTLGPSLSVSRTGLGAVLLRSGKVLLSGGGPDLSPTAELYDPIDGSMVAVGSGASARRFQSVLALADGRVFIAGGQITGGFATTVEVYDEGQGALPAFIPTLTGVTSTGTNTLNLTGTLFRGALQAAPASAMGNLANLPLFSFSTADGPTQLALTTSFSPTTATVELPASTVPGWRRVRVIVNGISSNDQLWLQGAPGAACTGDGGCATGQCRTGLCCDPACGAGPCSTWCAAPQTNPPARLVISTPARTFTTGTCAGLANAVTLELQDSVGRPTNAGTGGQAFTVSSSSSGTVGWFSDSSCTATVAGGMYVIAAGTRSISVYYRDSVAGMPIFTVSNGAGLTNPPPQMETVLPPAALHFVLSGISSPRNVGDVSDLTVAVDDDAGSRATGYLGTVVFSSSDPAAELPGQYAFTAGDNGQHVFAASVRFHTAGTQSVTATDTVVGNMVGTLSSIVVQQLTDAGCDGGTCAAPDGGSADGGCSDGGTCSAPPANLTAGCGCQTGAPLIALCALLGLRVLKLRRRV